MTDRDQDLQDAFDRAVRGEGAPPDTDHDPEAAAYEAVYAALGAEPEGGLPDDFAERVTARVGLTPEPRMGWAEILLLFLLIAGAGAGLVWMPPSVAGLPQRFGEGLRALWDLSGRLRVDVIVASALVLLATLGLDAFLRRFRLGPHSPSL